jgi:hypothetical protein
MCSIWSWHPPVGIYISILALLGVLVPLFRDWGEIGKREKAVWTAVMFLLVILEIKSIYQDRNEHDREQADARKEQLANFGTIANGINNSITASQTQFQATMDRLQTAVKSSEEARRNTEPHALITSLAMSPSGQARPASAVIFPNQSFEINVEFTNSGSEKATNVVLDLQTYLAKPDDDSSQKDLASRFNRWWKVTKHTAAVVPEVQPKDQRLATFKSVVFSPDDITALMNKSNTLYVLYRWVYSDSSGRWANDVCAGYQNVYQDFNVMHPCRPEYNRQRYHFPK